MSEPTPDTTPGRLTRYVEALEYLCFGLASTSLRAFALGALTFLAIRLAGLTKGLDLSPALLVLLLSAAWAAGLRALESRPNQAQRRLRELHRLKHDQVVARDRAKLYERRLIDDDPERDLAEEAQAEKLTSSLRDAIKPGGGGRKKSTRRRRR